MIELLTGAVGGMGAGATLAVLLSRGGGRRAAVRSMPELCSCSPKNQTGHGLGVHDKDGCHGIVIVEHFKDVWQPQVSDVERERWTERVPCGCRRFDGEVPAHIYGQGAMLP